jgi:hypothetical protein
MDSSFVVLMMVVDGGDVLVVMTKVPVVVVDG